MFQYASLRRSSHMRIKNQGASPREERRPYSALCGPMFQLEKVEVWTKMGRAARQNRLMNRERRRYILKIYRDREHYPG